MATDGMTIAGSRIMMRFLSRGEDRVNVIKVVVWNWKTGDVVRFCSLKESCFAHFVSGA